MCNFLLFWVAEHLQFVVIFLKNVCLQEAVCMQHLGKDFPQDIKVYLILDTLRHSSDIL